VYALDTLPAVIGCEAAGIIVSLPTDPSVLDDEDYKKRGYQIGDKVAVVRLNVFLSLLQTFKWGCANRRPEAYMQSTSLCDGRRFMWSLRRCRLVWPPQA
jgi:hypothetical protein